MPVILENNFFAVWGSCKGLISGPTFFLLLAVASVAYKTWKITPNLSVYEVCFLDTSFSRFCMAAILETEFFGGVKG